MYICMCMCELEDIMHTCILVYMYVSVRLYASFVCLRMYICINSCKYACICHLGWRTLLKCNKTNHACLYVHFVGSKHVFTTNNNTLQDTFITVTVTVTVTAGLKERDMFLDGPYWEDAEEDDDLSSRP